MFRGKFSRPVLTACRSCSATSSWPQIFAIAALSTNLLVGIIGIFSVSQAAIMGIGAYACALLLLNLDLPFFVALAGAMLICAAVNIVTSLPSLRLAGDYFVVTSFGIQLVATAVFINWSAVTGGVERPLRHSGADLVRDAGLRRRRSSSASRRSCCCWSRRAYGC